MRHYKSLALICAAVAGCTHSSAAQAKYKVLYSFTVANDGGGYPDAGVLRDTEGNLYGTTEIGGASDYGTIYRLAPDGTFSLLHSFAGSDGAYPIGGLIADGNGNLYGTTSGGGSVCSGGGCGTVFRLATDGTETVLHDFGGRDVGDGDLPEATLVMDRAGNLYGTTTNGGAAHRFHDHGTVFEAAPNGLETVLHSFHGGGDGMGGLIPSESLLRDKHGNLYGTTVRGGPSDSGTVFEIRRGRHESILYSFTGGSDGEGPRSGLVPDSAGNLYGTTAAGGSFGGGVVFHLAPDGTETVVRSFTGGKNDGANPAGTMVMDAAGNFYGVTFFGGNVSDFCSAGCGTIFRMAPDGSDTILHKFTYDDGAFPNDVIMDDQGHLYGTTHQGGAAGYGTVFEFIP